MRAPLIARATVAVAVLSLGQWVAVWATERSAAAMTGAAQAFVSSLRPEQRAHAVFDYTADERRRWHFIPNEMFPRRGLALRAMTAEQRAKAQALLQAGLSHKGYLTATAIIQLEDTLRALEHSQRFARSPLDYQFTVFGTPGARGAWGWRVEGHHLSLHFAVTNGRVVATAPLFTGAMPAEVKDGPAKGQRVLAPLEDTGRTLLESLSQPQRASAVIATLAPGEIVSSNNNDIGPLSPAGLAASAMTSAQKLHLTALLTAYASLMADDLAADRLARVTAAGLDRVTFAWAGPAARGAKHYYRVQGPTFLIEYDNTQNDGNHIHAVWRDFAGDFGQDVLREHLRADHAGPP